MSETIYNPDLKAGWANSVDLYGRFFNTKRGDTYSISFGVDNRTNTQVTTRQTDPTTGYTRYFSNKYAIVIPRTGREEVVANLAAAMERMTNADERTAIGEKAKSAGAQFTWPARGEEYKELLKKKISNTIH